MVTPVSSAAFRTQTCVIGAGVVGLAIARALAIRGKEVLLVDRASSICSETSSRNSEVIHAGLYYPTSSLKAKFCVEGKQSLYQFCHDHSISHNRCGKLVVATNESQLNKLEAIQQQANINGVSDVSVVSKQDVLALEPEVECVGALWSPSTGVIDSHSYFLSLQAEAEEHEAIVALHSKVEDARIVGSPGKLQLHAAGTWIECENVVNSAGLWASEIAVMIHKDNPSSWQPPRHYFSTGAYFRLRGAPPFQHLVYPVPEPGGLGVHATIDWAGCSVKFGPDVEWEDAEVTNPDGIDLNVDPQRGEKFYNEVRKYWPSLSDGGLTPDYIGIRPKLNHPSVGLGFKDFEIVGQEAHGIPGLIHLFGMESPGLTSSMAIADHVAALLDE